MSAPDIPKTEQKTSANAVSVNPVAAKVNATQPLPRQMFGSARPSLGAQMTSKAQSAAPSGRYDPSIVMDAIRRG